MADIREPVREMVPFGLSNEAHPLEAVKLSKQLASPWKPWHGGAGQLVGSEFMVDRVDDLVDSRAELCDMVKLPSANMNPLTEKEVRINKWLGMSTWSSYSFSSCHSLAQCPNIYPIRIELHQVGMLSRTGMLKSILLKPPLPEFEFRDKIN